MFLVAVVVGLFILVAEVKLRHDGVETYTRSLPSDFRSDAEPPYWARSHETLGWVSAGLEGEINPQGFRDARDFDALEAPDGGTERRAMVLGDSFVWGSGLRIEETLPVRLEQSLGAQWNVFNLGVPGWGIDQMYLAYRAFRDRLAPDLVVLFFIDDDVSRVLEAYREDERLAKPVLELRDGQLQKRTSANRIDDLANSVTGMSALASVAWQYVLLHREAIPLVRQILHSLKRETATRGERLIVVRIPTPRDATFASLIGSDAFGDLARRSNWEYWDADDLLTETQDWRDRNYLPDGHISSRGSRILSEWVAEVVRTRRLRGEKVCRPRKPSD